MGCLRWEPVPRSAEREPGGRGEPCAASCHRDRHLRAEGEGDTHSCLSSSPLLARFPFHSFQVVAEAGQNGREHGLGKRVRSQLTPSYSGIMGKSFNWETGNTSRSQRAWVGIPTMPLRSVALGKLPNLSESTLLRL